MLLLITDTSQSNSLSGLGKRRLVREGKDEFEG